MAIKVVVVSDNPLAGWRLASLVYGISKKIVVVAVAQSEEQAIIQANEAHADVVLLHLTSRARSGAQMVSRLVGATRARLILYIEKRRSQLCEQAIMHGARGIVHAEDGVAAIFKAIEKVRGGELWVDRVTSARLISDVTSGRKTTKDGQAFQALTPKERQIVLCMVKNPSLPAKQLADRLGMSHGTLRNHLSAIYGKLHVSNRTTLTLLARIRAAEPCSRAKTLCREKCAPALFRAGATNAR